MKILIYGINFAPELTGIGKYTGDMAAWLSQAGHEVRVVAAPPYYPAWEVGAGHHSSRFVRDSWFGAKVWRCPVWVPAKPRGAKRLFHLARFAAVSAPMMLRHVLWKPDVVWVVEPALFCAPVAWVTARLSRAKAWLHIQDFEVDAAFELGLLRGRGVRRVAEWCERLLMSGFDVVSTISQPMVKRALRKGVSAHRVTLFPNWVNLTEIRPQTGPNTLRGELGIPEHAVVALYSGNMGGKQGLEVLAETAALMRNDARVVHVFCGDGAGRETLVLACNGLPNVRFLPLQPLAKLSMLLGMADVHLLPQRAEAEDLVMPSKLTGMLSSGRPVVAMAQPGSAVDQVVRRCGLVVAPGNAQALMEAILTLAVRPDLRASLGAAGREYALAHFDRTSVLQRFESQLKQVVAGRSLEAEAPSMALPAKDRS
ncbi:MAG: glycosyltransferase WbuB [Rhizobacter sp.]|nr:glycosyltransferase WbuB [Rhizobacter sp.]